MRVIYPLDVHRRPIRKGAERISWPRQIHSQMVVAIERALQRLFNNAGALVPIPVRTVVARRRRDQRGSHD
jgi:hypothetical protein